MAEEGHVRRLGHVGRLEDNLEVGTLLLLVWFWRSISVVSLAGLECITLVTGCLNKKRWQFMISFLDTKTKTIMSDTVYQASHVISDLMGKKRRDKHL